MKQDRYFKFLAATIVIGVVLALVNPVRAGAPARATTASVQR
jgi:hypothetical protein